MKICHDILPGFTEHSSELARLSPSAGGSCSHSTVTTAPLKEGNQGNVQGTNQGTVQGIVQRANQVFPWEPGQTNWTAVYQLMVIHRPGSSPLQ